MQRCFLNGQHIIHKYGASGEHMLYGQWQLAGSVGVATPTAGHDAIGTHPLGQ